MNNADPKINMCQYLSSVKSLFLISIFKLPFLLLLPLTENLLKYSISTCCLYSLTRSLLNPLRSSFFVPPCLGHCVSGSMLTSILSNPLATLVLIFLDSSAASLSLETFYPFSFCDAILCRKELTWQAWDCNPLKGLARLALG